MNDTVKAAKERTAAAAKKPANAWRRTIAAAGVMVAKPWRRHRTAVFRAYVIGAMLILIILAVTAKRVAYLAFDVTLTHEVQTWNAGWFDALMRALTWIGFAPQVVVITLGILLFLYASGLKWESLVAFAGVLGSSALGLVLKVVVGRPRPSADLVSVISQLKDYSFPSEHVLFFTTFFGFLLFLAYTLSKHSWRRTLLLVMLGGMVALIGPSRIYVGQHWASDVVAAYLLGSVWLALSVRVYRWGKPRFFVDQRVARERPVSSEAKTQPPR